MPMPTTNPDLAVLVETRRSLHQVAEHLLSAERKRRTGHIGLQPAPGGFATPPLDDGTVLAVEGTEFVVRGPDGVRRSPLDTLAAAGERCGVEPGFPWRTHPPATELLPDRPLRVDPGAARLLADWFALGSAALAGLADELVAEAPTPAQIYPEHFDLGLTAGTVNFGVSPGDEDTPEPYLYVGPHEGPPVRDDFWNAPFGAARTRSSVDSVDDALSFFLDGHRRLHTHRTEVQS